MLSVDELKNLADLLGRAAPLVKRLGDLDVAAAEGNIDRLNKKSVELIAHYKAQAKAEALAEMADDLSRHTTAIASQRDAHDAKMAGERAALARDRAEVAALKDEMRRSTETVLGRALNAAIKEIK